MSKNLQLNIQFSVSRSDDIHNSIKTDITISGEQEYIMGRSHDWADIVINDPNASRKHLKIKTRYNQIWLEDQGTKNGTYLNGQKVEASLLKEGDIILVGSHIISISKIEDLNAVESVHLYQQTKTKQTCQYEIIRGLS